MSQPNAQAALVYDLAAADERGRLAAKAATGPRSRHASLPPPTGPRAEKAELLAMALRGCDAEWAKKLLDEGAEPRLMDEPPFAQWWKGYQALHDECSPQRLAAMVELLESMGEPLSLSLSRDLHRAQPGERRLQSERMALGDKIDPRSRVGRLAAAATWGELMDMSAQEWRSRNTGLRALMAHAQGWALDARAAERVSVGELMDGWALGGQAGPEPLGPLSTAASAWGEAIGARRWEEAAVALAGRPGKSGSRDRGYCLAKAMVLSLWPEPLTARAATACVSVACFEAYEPLLRAVCQRAPEIDWSLGEFGAAHLARCLGGMEVTKISGPEGLSARAPAVALARLAAAKNEERGYRSNVDKSCFDAVLEHAPAREAAGAHPCPEAWVHCSASELVALARAHPEFFAPDARGRTVALCLARHGDNARTIARMMACPALAGGVSAATDLGSTALAVAMARERGAEEVAELQKAVAAWERTSLKKHMRAEPGEAKPRKLAKASSRPRL